MTSATTAMRAYTFTVFTPAHNSATVLPKAYESLRGQTFGDFEWVVVDDGSTDRTAELVSEWAGEAPFPIEYIYQRNAGKPAATNRALEVARGEFVANLDHDDWYVPTTLERFVALWQSIPDQIRHKFVGGVALSADPKGKVIGTPFPHNELDSDYTELIQRYGVTGDKVGFGRTAIIRQFPFPVFDGERYCSEALVYDRIAARYKVRCVNEILQIKEYQDRSMSRWGVALLAESPLSSKLYYRELLTRSAASTLSRRYRLHANHTRFALHARKGRASVRDDPSKLWWAASAPAALALYLRDRIHLARRTAS